MNKIMRQLVFFYLFTYIYSVIEAIGKVSTGTCLNRQTIPQKSIYALDFCHIHPDESCCIPVQDAEIKEHYFNLLDAGDVCAKKTSAAKDYLKAVFCLGCSPLQPDFLAAPLNKDLYTSSEVVKICKSIVDNIHPEEFSDCGMTVVLERGNVCGGDNTVIPKFHWKNCSEGQYICQDPDSKEWMCKDSKCTPQTTPSGLTGNVSCFEEDGTCSGAFKFLNDNRGAKPPYFEDYPVEIVDKEACIELNGKDSVLCNCLEYGQGFTILPNLHFSFIICGFITYLLHWIELNE